MSWVIVPFARPDRLDNVRANFHRQSHEGKKLCIVENGPAIGACKAAGFEPDLLLTSEIAHPSAARNVGLDALQDFGEDAHFCCMDDDDFYGSFYQAEHLLFAARGQVTGKLPHWVHFASQGQLWLFNRNKAGHAVAWVQGPTVGGFVRDVGRFPFVPIGEELDFCAEHRKNGGTIRNTSVGHFCYMRSVDEADHLYRVTPVGYANTHGPWFEEHPLDLQLVVQSDPPRSVRKNFLQV